MRVLDIDPQRVHAYWEVTENDRKAALEQLRSDKGEPAWVLRFKDVTDLELNGVHALNEFDVLIELAARNWYVQLWEGGRSYRVELGVRMPNGRFVPLCRSNQVVLPGAGHDNPVQKNRVPDEPGDPEVIDFGDSTSEGQPRKMSDALADPRPVPMPDLGPPSSFSLGRKSPETESRRKA